MPSVTSVHLAAMPALLRDCLAPFLYTPISFMSFNLPGLDFFFPIFSLIPSNIVVLWFWIVPLPPNEQTIKLHFELVHWLQQNETCKENANHAIFAASFPTSLFFPFSTNSVQETDCALKSGVLWRRGHTTDEERNAELQVLLTHWIFVRSCPAGEVKFWVQFDTESLNLRLTLNWGMKDFASGKKIHDYNKQIGKPSILQDFMVTESRVYMRGTGKGGIVEKF
ncbi:hypothetical protein HPG69_001603 [Diceros bicornis minor]|uniref:Uncharacterized protein n=1 Tax=Diceros bicornis minor TaxID=77932 RepID=A0A7J7FG19_DICBM|nr:hypothetical protein HPG69_001603 [Diceros bicornis minor]